MILLDTHIWLWWVSEAPRLDPVQRRFLSDHEKEGLGVSVISCWEVAKKVETKNLLLDRPLAEWLDEALDYPGIRLIPLTPRIVVESVQLPVPFHRDPADQLIVATARILDCPLLTVDEKLLGYAHVRATDGAAPRGS